MTEASTPAASAAPREGTGPLVLVVEDNPINALVAMESLKRFGMRGAHVAGGEEALAVMRTTRFDLVLMDCQMPGLDGFETTRRWRAEEAAAAMPVRRLPIIAVTANAAAGDRERCLAAGMDDYVSKPFELTTLRAKIEQHLGAAP